MNLRAIQFAVRRFPGNGYGRTRRETDRDDAFYCTTEGRLHNCTPIFGLDNVQGG